LGVTPPVTPNLAHVHRSGHVANLKKLAIHIGVFLNKSFSISADRTTLRSTDNNLALEAGAHFLQEDVFNNI